MAVGSLQRNSYGSWRLHLPLSRGLAVSCGPAWRGFMSSEPRLSSRLRRQALQKHAGDTSHSGTWIGGEITSHRKVIGAEVDSHGKLIGDEVNSHRKLIGDEVNSHGELIGDEVNSHGKLIGGEANSHGELIGDEVNSHGKFIGGEVNSHGTILIHTGRWILIRTGRF